MRQRLSTRARGNLSRGALISLLLHLNVVAPVVIAAWIYGGRQEAQRAEEVDVAFQAADQTELPPDLPPIEPSPETLEPEAKKAPKPDKKRPELVKVPKPEAQKKPETPKKGEARARGDRSADAAHAPAAAAGAEGAREDGRPRQRQGCSAAARREVPGAEEQPRRGGDARPGHEHGQGAEGGGRGVVEVGARRQAGRRRQGEDRAARGGEVEAGTERARRDAAPEPRALPAGSSPSTGTSRCWRCATRRRSSTS